MKKKFLLGLSKDIFVYLLSLAWAYILFANNNPDFSGAKIKPENWALILYGGVNLWIMLIWILQFFREKGGKMKIRQELKPLLYFSVLVAPLSFFFTSQLLAGQGGRIIFFFTYPALTIFNIISVFVLWIRFEVEENSLVLINDSELFCPGDEYVALPFYSWQTRKMNQCFPIIIGGLHLTFKDACSVEIREVKVFVKILSCFEDKFSFEKFIKEMTKYLIKALEKRAGEMTVGEFFKDNCKVEEYENRVSGVFMVWDGSFSFLINFLELNALAIEEKEHELKIAQKNTQLPEA